MKARVFAGMLQELDNLPHHASRKGIRRYKLTDNNSLPGKTFHTAVHVIGPEYYTQNERREYASHHVHDHDEINLLLSERGSLTVRYELDGEISLQQSPALIFIPAGVSHRGVAVAGEGMLVCLRLDTLSDAS